MGGLQRSPTPRLWVFSVFLTVFYMEYKLFIALWSNLFIFFFLQLVRFVYHI